MPGQRHLRSSLHFLDVPTVGQPEVDLHFRDEMIAPDGTVASDSTRGCLQRFLDAYAAWVERFCAQ